MAKSSLEALKTVARSWRFRGDPREGRRFRVARLSRGARIVGGLAVVVVGVVAAAGAGSSPASTETTATTNPMLAGQEMTADVRAALPAASVSLVQASGGGEELRFVIPSSGVSAFDAADVLSAPANGSASDNGEGIGDVAAGELSWRAEMAADYAGSQDSEIVGYGASTSGIRLTPEQQSWMSGQIRALPGGRAGFSEPNLDSLTVSEAENQLESNLRVLRSAVGSTVPLATSVTAIPLSSTNSDIFALQANIAVAQLSELQSHIGDVKNGLWTGLVGDSSAPIEGLSVILSDDSGEVAGFWTSSRDGSGGEEYPSSAGLNLDGGIPADVTFPNLTGGPPTSVSYHG